MFLLIEQRYHQDACRIQYYLASLSLLAASARPSVGKIAVFVSLPRESIVDAFFCPRLKVLSQDYNRYYHRG